MVKSSHKVLCTVSTLIEAELVKQNLAMEGIDAIILSEKDSSFSLTVGELAEVLVYVSNEDYDAALELFIKTQNN